MLLKKTKTLAILVLLLALTGCGSTPKPSVTVAQTIDEPCQKPSAELLVKPMKPDAPASGNRADVLNHAVQYGEYVQTLELQLNGWIELYGEKENGR